MFYPDIEAFSIEVEIQTLWKNVMLVYHLQSSRPQEFISQSTKLVADKNPHITIGDFNMDVTTAAETHLIVALSPYKQHVNKPTHNTVSTLDLAFIMTRINQ